MSVRFDRGNVNRTVMTDEGYLRAESVITRTGVFSYMNADGSIRKELRHPDDVLRGDSLETLKMLPVTNGHPENKLVNADNSKELSVGWTGETVAADGAFILSTLKITDGDAVEAVKSGKKRELSLGYTVELVREDGEYNGQSYTHRQTNIRYNHLAIVERARAGREARIHLDSGDAIEIEEINQKENDMNEQKKVTVTLDGIEYNAAPEVANAYKKAKQDHDNLSQNINDLKIKLDTITAERDSLKEKYEAEIKVDKEAIIQEAVKTRVKLVNDCKDLMGNKAGDMNLYDMNEIDIMKAVVKDKCPNANLDGQTDIYVKARFDSLVEDKALYVDSAIAKQRKAVANTDNASRDREEVDAENARRRMMDRLKNNYKNDKNKK